MTNQEVFFGRAGLLTGLPRRVLLGNPTITSKMFL
jgi:hypothetical protein